MKYLCIFMILIISGCSFNNSSPYIKDLKELDKDLTTHFPKNSNGLLSLTSFVADSNSIIKNNGNFIITAFKYDIVKDFLKTIEHDFEKYGIADSCQLILTRDSKVLLTNNCYCNSIPIPTFVVQIDHFKLLGEDFDLETAGYEDLRLPEDFEYYIKAKNGLFLDSQLLFKDSRLPDCWAHGYSKGYAISEKRNLVLIWVDLW